MLKIYKRVCEFTSAIHLRIEDEINMFNKIILMKGKIKKKKEVKVFHVYIKS